MACRAPRSPLGSAGGYSLLEVLVAVALAGFLTIALSTGLVVLIRTNALLRSDQELQRALGNLAEALEAVPYASCEGVGNGDPSPSVGGLTADAAAARDRYVAALADGPDAVLERTTGTDGAEALRPRADWRSDDGLQLEVVGVDFWEKVTFPTDAVPPATVPAGPGAFVAACPLEHTTGGALVLVGGQPVVIDDGAQQVTLRARSGERTQVLQVVVADRADAVAGAGP